jgi:NAD(P)-dependent dehydrogenase (short-subunit alcohol dehydrogenase family)
MAQALAEVGVKAIALLDVQQETGDAAAAALHESTGIPVQFYKVDIRDAKAVSEVVTKVAEEYGSLDVMINSAGIAE